MCLPLGIPQQRRRHQGEHVVGIADMLAEQPHRRRGSGGRGPCQLKVAIGRRNVIVEPDEANVIGRRIDCDGVMMAFDLAEREAGIEMHRDGDRIGRRLHGRIEHRRRDAVAIRYRIVGAAPAAAAKIDGLHDRRRIVARRDHEGHAQR